MCKKKQQQHLMLMTSDIKNVPPCHLDSETLRMFSSGDTTESGALPCWQLALFVLMIGKFKAVSLI